MGFDPRARTTAPFETRENHLLLAEQAGVGTADLHASRCGEPASPRFALPSCPAGAAREPRTLLSASGGPIG